MGLFAILALQCDMFGFTHVPGVESGWIMFNAEIQLACGDVANIEFDGNDDVRVCIWCINSANFVVTLCCIFLFTPWL